MTGSRFVGVLGWERSGHHYEAVKYGELASARLSDADLYADGRWEVSSEIRTMIDGRVMVAVIVRQGERVILCWNNIDLTGEVIPPVGEARWPDVTPRPDIPPESPEGQIRSSAWEAGHEHARARHGAGERATWDASDWHAASARYWTLRRYQYLNEETATETEGDK